MNSCGKGKKATFRMGITDRLFTILFKKIIDATNAKVEILVVSTSRKTARWDLCHFRDVLFRFIQQKVCYAIASWAAPPF